MAALWEQVARDWMVDEEGGDGFVVFTLSRLPSCGFQANLPFPSAVLLCVFLLIPPRKTFPLHTVSYSRGWGGVKGGYLLLPCSTLSPSRAKHTDCAEGSAGGRLHCWLLGKNSLLNVCQPLMPSLRPQGPAFTLSLQRLFIMVTAV